MTDEERQAEFAKDPGAEIERRITALGAWCDQEIAEVTAYADARLAAIDPMTDRKAAARIRRDLKTDLWHARADREDWEKYLREVAHHMGHTGIASIELLQAMDKWFDEAVKLHTLLREIAHGQMAGTDEEIERADIAHIRAELLARKRMLEVADPEWGDWLAESLAMPGGTERFDAAIEAGEIEMSIDAIELQAHLDFEDAEEAQP